MFQESLNSEAKHWATSDIKIFVCSKTESFQRNFQGLLGNGQKVCVMGVEGIVKISHYISYPQ